MNADEVTKQLKAKAQKPDDICHKDIWYKLLRDETIYRPYIYAMYMMYTCEILLLSLKLLTFYLITNFLVSVIVL